MVLLQGIDRVSHFSFGALADESSWTEEQRAEGVGVLDVAPTVLAWAGLPTGRDMAGRATGFVNVEPVATIASYENEPIPRLARTAAGLGARATRGCRRWSRWET